jgi:VWFA-related protein
MAELSHYSARILPIFICIVWSLGQSPSASQLDPSRIVSVPVTVMNRNGEPVRGLNASSFSLLQDGRKQTVDSILEVAPITVGKGNVKIAFVAYDALRDGTLEEDLEARRECLGLLADAATNESPISFFQIDQDGFLVVHEVATPNPILASALLQLDKEARFLKHRNQLEAKGATPEATSLVVAEADRLRRFRNGTVQSKVPSGQFAGPIGTLLLKLKGLQEMALALQSVHGRKTVIWLAGWFPVEVNDRAERIVFFDRVGALSPIVSSASVDYQRTIDLLNEAQISIYPVLMGRYFPSSGISDFAQSTGGEIIYKWDTLLDAVKRAEDRSTPYYLLTFHAAAIKSDLKWTRLKIKLSGESLRVRSPSGLFVFVPPK